MWRQFDFICSQDPLRLYPTSQFYERFFRFKKELLPILDKYQIMDFLILDEGKYFLLRVELDDEETYDFTKELDSLVNASSDFTNVTLTTWSPEDDARIRILGGKRKSYTDGRLLRRNPCRGWRIESLRDGRWIAEPDDLNSKIDKFARFISRVIVRFTSAYLEEITERVDDRWLLSVFIHLLLHSISEQRFERQTRAFPAI